MRRKSIVVVVLMMFALALGAGVVAGKLSSRLPGREIPPAAAQRGTLSDVLQLSSDQREKMQAVWEGVRDVSHDCLAQAQRAQREQDEALMAMLTDEQKAQYSRLTQQTAGKIAVLDARRKEAFKKAVQETSALLNDSQRKTYEQLIKDRVGEVPDGGWERP